MTDHAQSRVRPRARRANAASTISLDGLEVTLLPATAYDVRYTPGFPVIGFAFEAQDGAHAFASDRKRPFRARPNSLAYIPAGCEVTSRSPTGGEYLTISVAHSGQEPALPERRFNDYIDRRAIAAAESLRRTILSGADFEVIEVERDLVE